MFKAIVFLSTFNDFCDLVNHNYFSQDKGDMELSYLLCLRT